LQISRKLKKKQVLPRRLRNKGEEPKESGLEEKLNARNWKERSRKLSSRQPRLSRMFYSRI